MFSLVNFSCRISRSSSTSYPFWVVSFGGPIVIVAAVIQAALRKPYSIKFLLEPLYPKLHVMSVMIFYCDNYVMHIHQYLVSTGNNIKMPKPIRNLGSEMCGGEGRINFKLT